MIGINKWYQSFTLRYFDLEDMELESTNSGPTAKLPILKLGEYETWAIRIKQYFQIQDYALWEVIENGDSWVLVSQKSQENGITVTKMSTPATAKEKTNKKNDVKARGLLLMALPNEHQLTFSQFPDAKSMFAPLETRFVGHLQESGRAPRSKEGQFRNQDNTRKQGNHEDISSKAMLAIDGVGFDWSDMAEEQVQTNMALMTFSDSEVYTDKTCSKTCLKNYETLKKQCDDLLVKLNESDFKAATYKRGLATIEAQLITYKKNEVLFSEEVVVLKRECLQRLRIIFKGKSDKLTKSKKGWGYKQFLHLTLNYNRPNKLDLSYSGLDEFKEPEFKGYGPENSKQESNVVCEKESENSKENSDESLVEEQVTQDQSSFVESSPNVDKETVFPANKKVEFTKPENHEKPVKKQVRNKFNAVRGTSHEHDDKYVVDMMLKHMTGKFDAKVIEGFRCLIFFEYIKLLGTVSNDSAGTSEENSQDCIVMPIWKDTSYFDSPTKDVDNGEPKTADDAQKQVEDGLNNENAEQESLKLNTVGPSVSTASPNEEDSTEEEPEVDLGNITNSYIVPTTPNTRIHKDHPIDNVIGEVQSTVQTRRMSKPTSEQGFLSDIEPTSIAKALSDSSWVEAMQEELLQFKLQQVWILVDLPNGKKAIGTKWVFRNKKDERGIVIRNKARIEAIRLFLAYASFMGFLVYQMDVKSAFLYGTIEEEVYVTQPPGFKDPDHPDKVYKVVKHYGLHFKHQEHAHERKVSDEFYGRTYFLSSITSTTEGRWNIYKSMFAIIETRFRGNAAIKKTQKTLSKQQYENFSATSAESLDSIFNRLQKIVSRLAILGVIIAQEDLNLKFLSSLPPEWNTHIVVWMNKHDIETMSIDDLYNNFKIVEQNIKKTVGTSSGGQNLAFMTAPSSSSTNDANTAYSQVSAASPSVNTASPQVCTASVSDNTVYSFMVENPNGSNVLLRT
ncbi:putative ribonuclease H-like domain-containing protein [Tanacetum coccineum]